MTFFARLTLTSAAVLLAAASFHGVAMEPQSANPVVIIETSLGNITVELYQDKAPKTVANVLEYVKAGYYKDTIFHRVIKGFMIQGGGMTVDLSRKPTRPPIENEATNGLKNSRGTIAMARTADVNSATSQFFINTVDNSSLDHRSKTPDAFGYCVFGKVTGGMSVVDQIENSATTTRNGYRDVPETPIVIKDIRLRS